MVMKLSHPERIMIFNSCIPCYPKLGAEHTCDERRFAGRMLPNSAKSLSVGKDLNACIDVSADRDANRKAARFAHLHCHVLRDARILTMDCGILRGILPTLRFSSFWISSNHPQGEISFDVLPIVVWRQSMPRSGDDI